MRHHILRSFALIAAFAAGPVLAQGTGISLSPIEIDGSQPIEVTADNLTVEQDSNSAVFEGNARVVQGDLILAANKILVRYNAEQTGIERVEATSNVMFTNGTEIAEAQNGVYTIGSSSVKMSGDVVLVQGINAIFGDTLNLDLKTNRGTMSGNVKTVFVPKTDQ